MTRLGRLLGALGARELARRLGRSPGTVQRWAKSGRVPEAAADDLRSVDRRRAAARAAARARKEQAEKQRRRQEELAKEKARRAEEKSRAEAKKERERKERAKREKSEKEASEKKRREEAARQEREKREVAERARREAAKQAEEKARREAEAKSRAEAEAKRKALEAAKEKKERERREKEDKKKHEAEKERRFKRIDELDRRRKVLEEACRLLTSNRSIGEAIGVDEATVRRWMTDPPLKSAPFDKLEKLVASIHTLSELMKQAGEIEKLPTIQSGHGRRSGRKTDGVYWTRTFMSFLDPHLLKQIENWISGHKGRWPYWQGVAITSQYALRSDLNFKDVSDKDVKDRDYKTIYIQVGKAKWGDFASDRPEPTGQRGSAKEAAADLIHRLRQKMESGVVQVFVHGVTLFAYRRRTKDEEMKWSSTERQERHERWQEKTGSKGTKAKGKKRKRRSRRK